LKSYFIQTEYYLVQFQGHNDPSLICSTDISCFGNGDDIKKGGKDAIESWSKWRKETKKDRLSATLLLLDVYSTLPCRDLHSHYSVPHSDPGPDHDLNFWVLYGCKNPLHYRPLRTGSLDYDGQLELAVYIKIVAMWPPEVERPFNTGEAQQRLDAFNEAKKR
jgi:hypothetical protein